MATTESLQDWSYPPNKCRPKHVCPVGGFAPPSCYDAASHGSRWARRGAAKGENPTARHRAVPLLTPPPTRQRQHSVGRTAGTLAASPLPGAFFGGGLHPRGPTDAQFDDPLGMHDGRAELPRQLVTNAVTTERGVPNTASWSPNLWALSWACLTYGMACYDADPLRARDAPGTLLWPSSDPPPIHGQSSGFSKDRTPAA